MNLGENIYHLRSERNMSQGDLADALDVSRQSVSKWENNSATPELDKLLKMSELFGVSLDQLVGREGTPSKPVSEVHHIHIQSSIRPARVIVGAILLGVSFLTLLLFTLFNSLTIGFMFALPLALCGIVCFAFQKQTGIWCAWVLYFSIAIVFPQLTGMVIPLSFELRSTMIATLFIQLPLAIYTIVAFRHHQISLSRKTVVMFTVGCVLFFTYLALRLYDTIADPTWKIWRIAVLLNPLHFALFTALLVTILRIQKSKCI